MTVAKIIACILIVSYLTNTSMAAPLADNQQQQQQQSGSQETKSNRKNPEQRMIRFTNQEVEMWTNPCSAESIIDSNMAMVDPKIAYGNIHLQVKELVLKLNESDKINTTNYEAWEEFNGHKYEFLPKKPRGNHRQWHFDMQQFVATFIILEKNQKIEDEFNNNNTTMSKELSSILQDAKRLLCEIEHFVNATSSQKIGEKDWIKKKEMVKLIKFQNLTDMFLHRTFAKGRFQDYVRKLSKRIKEQDDKNYIERKVSYPKLKALGRNKQGGTKKARRGNRRIQNGRKNVQQYEVTPTKRVHIVRTSKMPAQPRNNKNKNSRRRQRTKTTTTSTTVASV